MDIGQCKYFNRFQLQFKCTGEGVGNGTIMRDNAPGAVMFVRIEGLWAVFYSNTTGVAQFHLFCTARVYLTVVNRLRSGFGRVHLLM